LKGQRIISALTAVILIFALVFSITACSKSITATATTPATTIAAPITLIFSGNEAGTFHARYLSGRFAILPGKNCQPGYRIFANVFRQPAAGDIKVKPGAATKLKTAFEEKSICRIAEKNISSPAQIS
jgi:hypothetical protein